MYVHVHVHVVSESEESTGGGGGGTGGQFMRALKGWYCRVYVYLGVSTVVGFYDLTACVQGSTTS